MPNWWQPLARLIGSLALVLTCLVGLPSGAASAPDSAVVATSDGLNLRSGPGTGYDIVLRLPSGARLAITGAAVSGWYPVAYGGAAGWAAGDYLAFADGPAATAPGIGGPATRSAALESFDLDLPLPFHRQLTPIWCDPADIQTWSEYQTGQSAESSQDFQQATWDWELDHNLGFSVDEWDASPYAVASGLHHWMPDRGFNHFIYDDPLEATKLMAWLLANPNYREPSIATIWQGDHYILVRGVRAIGDPYRDYPNAQILGVYVMDPNQGRPSWLGVDRYIPIGEWLGVHFTPVTYLTAGAGVPGDVWQQKYVTIQRDWTSSGPTPNGRHNATPDDYAG